MLYVHDELVLVYSHNNRRRTIRRLTPTVATGLFGACQGSTAAAAKWRHQQQSNQISHPAESEIGRRRQHDDMYNTALQEKIRALSKKCNTF